MIDVNVLGITFIKDHDFVKGYVLRIRPKFKEAVLQVRHLVLIVGIEKRYRIRKFFKCYECDGRGWMYLDEFLERDQLSSGILGDEVAAVLCSLEEGILAFEPAICPFCEGTGRGW